MLFCSCLLLHPAAWAGRNPVLGGREKEKAGGMGNKEVPGQFPESWDCPASPRCVLVSILLALAHDQCNTACSTGAWKPLSGTRQYGTGWSSLCRPGSTILPLPFSSVWLPAGTASFGHSNAVYFTRDEKLGEKHLCLAWSSAMFQHFFNLKCSC